MPEPITYLEAIKQGIWEEMERDETVFILGEDVGVYGGAFRITDGMLEKFGEMRVVDTPISEALIVGAASGAALMGMKPIAEMQFIDFISCAFDQITNFASNSFYRWGEHLPIVIRGPAGGGTHGGPFHSQNVESYFFNTPGLKIVQPSTVYDAKGLIKSAIRDPNPVIYLEHKFLYRRIKETIPEDDFTVPIGEARIARSGKDISIITYGAMVWSALEAADKLSKEDNIELEVVDLRSILPYDKDMILQSLKRTNRVIIFHEATLTGGPGGEFASFIAQEGFDYLDAPIVRVAAPDTPVPYAPPLENFFLPNAEKLMKAVRKLAKY